MSTSSWLTALACAVASTLADTLGTLYWEGRRPGHLLATIALAPFVFLLFGYVGAQRGLAMASGLTNSLVVAGPLLVGLVVRREFADLSGAQRAGLLVTLAGLVLIVLSPSKAR